MDNHRSIIYPEKKPQKPQNKEAKTNTLHVVRLPLFGHCCLHVFMNAEKLSIISFNSCLVIISDIL